MNLGRRTVGTIYRRTRPDEQGTKRQRAEVRFDEIAGCLRTPAGGSSRQTILVVEGRKVRSRLLSTREAARLMGLSDDYRLPERYNEAYHVCGDGVCVPVVRHLGRTPPRAAPRSRPDGRVGRGRVGHGDRPGVPPQSGSDPDQPNRLLCALRPRSGPDLCRAVGGRHPLAREPASDVSSKRHHCKQTSRRMGDRVGLGLPCREQRRYQRNRGRAFPRVSFKIGPHERQNAEASCA